MSGRLKSPAPNAVRVVRNAMATRFEIVLLDGPAPRLRAAGEEALEEVARLEDRLSLYRTHSDVGRLNAAVDGDWVRITPDTFRLLELAREISDGTGGAFDPTAGPLIRAWGFTGGSGHRPAAQALAEAAARCGWIHVELDPIGHRVRLQAGVSLDLGAIGKGHALDRAAEILADAGVTNALLHGGTSSIVAIGPGPAGGGWRVALPGADGACAEPLETLGLVDTSLAVSATWGKSFEESGKILGHVIDPRTGHPVAGARSAVVTGPRAALTDALSTALLVLGASASVTLEERFPGYRAVWIP